MSECENAANLQLNCDNVDNSSSMKSSSKKVFSSIRTCVEKELPNQRQKISQLSKMSGKDINIVSAAYLKSKIWPNRLADGSPNTITIQFLESGNNVPWTPLELLNNYKIYKLEQEINGKLNGIDTVKRVVMEILQPLVGIKFEFVNRNGNIKIGFDTNEGAYSYVGTDCLQYTNEKTMNLGWLDVGTIIHEFLHALGCIHEHQNPKNNSIDWNKNKVYCWAKQTQDWNPEVTCHNIFEKYNQEQLNGSDFDIDSIMLYFFPDKFTNNNKGTKQNFVLSETDKQWLKNMYPINGESKKSNGESKNGGNKVIVPESEKEKNKKKGSFIDNWLIVILFIVLMVIYFILSFLSDSGLDNTKSNRATTLKRR